MRTASLSLLFLLYLTGSTWAQGAGLDAALEQRIEPIEARVDALEARPVVPDLTTEVETNADKNVKQDQRLTVLEDASPPNGDELARCLVERDIAVKQAVALGNQVSELQVLNHQLQTQNATLQQAVDDKEAENNLLRQQRDAAQTALEECRAGQSGGDIALPPDIGSRQEDPVIDFVAFVLIHPDFGGGAATRDGLVEAVNAAQSTGKRVVFNNGNYCFDERVRLRDTVHWFGEGMSGKADKPTQSGTVFSWCGPSGGTMFWTDRDSGWTQASMQDFVIDGTNLGLGFDLVQPSNGTYIANVVWRDPPPLGIFLQNERSLGEGNDPHAAFTFRLINQFVVGGVNDRHTLIRVDGNTRMLMAQLDVQGAVVADIRSRNPEQSAIEVHTVTWHRNRGAGEGFIIRDRTALTVFNGQVDNFGTGADRADTLFRCLGSECNVALVGGRATSNEAGQGLRNWVVHGSDVVPVLDGDRNNPINYFGFEVVLAPGVVNPITIEERPGG